MRVIEQEELVDAYFWRDTPSRESNPILMLAQILRGLGMGILISDRAYDRHGRLPDQVAIFATVRAKSILDVKSASSKIAALCAVENPTQAEPNLEQCDWDPDTRKRLEAFYWERKAVGYEQLADSFFKQSPLFAIRHDVKAIGARARAEIIRGDLKPFTLEDMRNLVLQKVEEN